MIEPFIRYGERENEPLQYRLLPDEHGLRRAVEQVQQLIQEMIAQNERLTQELEGLQVNKSRMKSHERPKEQIRVGAKQVVEFSLAQGQGQGRDHDIQAVLKVWQWSMRLDGGSKFGGSDSSFEWLG